MKNKKELSSFSKEEYNSLLKSGMFFEYYPEATGCYSTDIGEKNTIKVNTQYILSNLYKINGVGGDATLHLFYNYVKSLIKTYNDSEKFCARHINNKTTTKTQFFADMIKVHNKVEKALLNIQNLLK